MNEPRTSGEGVQRLESMSFSERLTRLDEAEKSIAQAMQSASHCLAELSKDKTATRQAENHAQEFSKRLQFIEKTVTAQISYLYEVGVGAAHEGSAYSQLRGKLAAEEKLNYIHAKLSEYGRTFKKNRQEHMDCDDSSV